MSQKNAQVRLIHHHQLCTNWPQAEAKMNACSVYKQAFSSISLSVAYCLSLSYMKGNICATTASQDSEYRNGTPVHCMWNCQKMTLPTFSPICQLFTAISYYLLIYSTVRTIVKLELEKKYASYDGFLKPFCCMHGKIYA